MNSLPHDRIIGARVTRIAHSAYSDPEFVLQGIGPASFRSHYIFLDSQIILDLFTAEITIVKEPQIETDGETSGIPIQQLLGLSVTSLQCDDAHSSLIILNHDIYLRDANDGATGNPLVAGYLTDYTPEQRVEFLDYFTEQPLHKRDGRKDI